MRALSGLSLGVVVAFLTLSSRQPAVQNDCAVRKAAVVRDSSVGPIKLGMAFSDIKRSCKVIRDTVLPDYDYAELQRVLVIDLGLDTVLVKGSVSPLDSNQTNQRVVSITIAGPRLRTLDSLRVGMTLRELRRRRGLRGGVS